MSSTQNFATADNVGPAVNVTTWLLGVAVVLFVVARLTTKVYLAQTLGLDDCFIITATLFSIGLIVTVSLEVRNGLGQHETNLLPWQLAGFQKTAYAGDILYILSLSFSKLAVLLLIHRITPVNAHQLLISGAAVISLLWSLTGLFAAAFQCQAPRIWEILEGQCFAQVAFWTYLGVFNIITEFLLVGLPIVILWGVHMPANMKVVIASVFFARILVIGTATAELVFRNRNADTADRTFTTWTVVICSQFIQALSIITACVPYLKPFFSSLETGMLRTDDSRRLESRSRQSKQRSKARTKKIALSTKLRSSGSRPGSSTFRFNVLHEDYISGTHIVGGHSHVRTDDTRSLTSRTKILKQTDIWVGNTEDKAICSG